MKKSLTNGIILALPIILSICYRFYMKKFIHKVFKKNDRKIEQKDRAKIEREVVEGAKKAVTEYRRVFERLAEYDKI